MKKFAKLAAILFIISLLSVFATSCSSSTTPTDTNLAFNQFDPPKAGEKIAIIETSMGTIKVRLFPQYAPKAVENFIGLAEQGYYDNLIFHRVIKDFMIQGGDPDGTGMGGESIWGSGFGYEFHEDLNHFKGALSMAHSSAPDSNGSQFFVVQAPAVPDEIFATYETYGYTFNKMPESVIADYKTTGGTPWLDGLYTPEGTDGHTVFGQTYEGLDVIDKIAGTAIGPNDKPIDDVIIKSVKIEDVK